jgi:uncharacterized protein (UPF0548 family)
MWFRKPSHDSIRAFLARQAAAPYSYPEVGATRATPPAGYTLDHRQVCLGEGEPTFRLACAALRRWEMFRLGWVELYWPDTPLEPGKTVAVLGRVVGLWWLSVTRIVYVLDESTPMRRFGFAYGTLDGHPMRGEERFLIEWRGDNTVWYDLLAFSRPGSWLTWLGYPLARRAQRRFGVESLAAMARAVKAGPDVSPGRGCTHDVSVVRADAEAGRSGEPGSDPGVV